MCRVQCAILRLKILCLCAIKIMYHHILRLQCHWTEQSRHVSTTSSSSLYPTHHRPEPTRFQCVQSQLSQQVSIVTCCLVYKCCALSNTMSIHVIPYKVLLCMYYMATMNLIGQLWLASYRFQLAVIQSSHTHINSVNWLMVKARTPRSDHGQKLRNITLNHQLFILANQACK